MKIRVKTVKVKKQTPEFTISEIETDMGEKLDTFDKLEEGGEYDGTIKANDNPKYNANFKLDKPKNGGGKTFPQKDYTFEKKRVALECAVSLANKQGLKATDVVAVADTFYKYFTA